MRIGLVGYFGFGNYGDELFVEVHRRSFVGHEVAVLGDDRWADGYRTSEIERHDAVIIGGGDLVLRDRYVNRYWDPALLARPVFIAGVGVDFRRRTDPQTVSRLASFFQHENVGYVSARDERSRKWIVENLRPRCRVLLHADLVASLHFCRVPSVTPTLGVIVRANESIDRQGYRRLIEAAQRNGFRAKTIVLGTGSTAGEDLGAINEFTLDGEVVTRACIDDLTTEIATCDVLASQRFHGCLAGMLMGIPTVGLLDSEKFSSLFKQTNLEHCLMALDDPLLPTIVTSTPELAAPATIASIRASARSGVEALRGAVLSRKRRLATHQPGAICSGANRDGFLTSRRDVSSRQEERSPRLRSDPRAALDPQTELTWYRDEIRKQKGRAYAATLDRLIDWTPQLRCLSRSTRAIVAIPVAGTAESDHIYGTLSLYAQQNRAALRDTVVLAYVNYPANVRSDHLASAQLDLTLHQIEAARTDFPQLNLAMVEEAFDPDLPAAHRGIIGYIGRRLYDLAMMSVERAMRKGRLDHDVLLIRNDADALGMSNRYLERLLQAAGDHPETDVFQGGMRWGTHRYRDYPGFGVSMAFKEALRALTLRPGTHYRAQPGTSGSNVAVRMATLGAVGGVGNSDYFGAGGDDVEIGLRVLSARRSPPASTNDQTPRRPIRYVADAQIDASGERPLATYRNGRTIIETWDTYNSGPGGYMPRTEQPSDQLIGPERFDDDGIVDRIERNFNALTQAWYTDRDLVDSALRCVVGSADEEGRPVYELGTNGDRTVVTFTPAGRRWIGRRLSKTRSGTASPYGRRLRRSLYGETAGSRAASRMVSAL